jgi:hypothetical protein
MNGSNWLCAGLASSPESCGLARHVLSWLAGRLVEIEESPPKSGEKSEKNVWMVHSNGFYLVEKQKRPSLMHGLLPCFKWVAGSLGSLASCCSAR